jgi:hypothetical protein
MMVKPRCEAIFCVSGNIGASGAWTRRSRMAKLVCFEIEANRNVGPDPALRRRSKGAKSAWNHGDWTLFSHN